MKLDAVHPVAKVLSEWVPKMEWKEGESSLTLRMPCVLQTVEDGREVPYIKIKLHKEEFEYIQSLIAEDMK